MTVHERVGLLHGGGVESACDTPQSTLLVAVARVLVLVLLLRDGRVQQRVQNLLHDGVDALTEPTPHAPSTRSPLHVDGHAALKARGQLVLVPHQRGGIQGGDHLSPDYSTRHLQTRWRPHQQIGAQHRLRTLHEALAVQQHGEHALRQAELSARTVPALHALLVDRLLVRRDARTNQNGQRGGGAAVEEREVGADEAVGGGEVEHGGNALLVHQLGHYTSLPVARRTRGLVPAELRAVDGVDGEGNVRHHVHLGAEQPCSGSKSRKGVVFSRKRTGTSCMRLAMSLTYVAVFRFSM